MMVSRMSREQEIGQVETLGFQHLDLAPASVCKSHCLGLHWLQKWSAPVESLFL